MAAVSLENWVERIRDPKIECMSRDEMADLQSRRLVDVVKRVYDNVPFYRRKMQQRGVEPGDIRSIEDIGKLPFTTKEDLRDNYPFGLLAIPKKDVVRVQGTSGTTGKLTIAPYSQKDVDVWGECVARGLTMAGLTEEDIIHVCYGYGLFTGGLGLDYGAKALGAMAIPMSALVRAGASLMPSPTIATLPFFFRERMTLSFPSGSTPAMTSSTPA